LVSDLTSTMLNLPLYVMLRTTVQPALLSEELVLAHLRWMIEQEGQGRVFASGPFVVPDLPRGAAGGMTILRAADEQQAVQIGQEDPFVKAGAVAFQMHKWMLMEGAIQLTLRYSSQSFSMELT